jgi:FixJ family two-component response regulator
VSRTPVRVYVVDEDSPPRASLVRWLKQWGHGVRTFPSGEAFVLDFPALQPGCIIVDAAMAGGDGQDAQRRLISLGCRWPLIALTGRRDEGLVRRAMERGAVALLSKPVRRVELLAALVRADQYLLNAAEAIPDPEVLRRMALLTARQREVLRGVLDGRINKEMAAQFGITESAVKSCRGEVMRKLQVRTAAELVTFAYRAGWKLQRPS